jgi:ribonuclease-3 family protein
VIHMTIEKAAWEGLESQKPLAKKPHEMPGLALAYIGDAVWEMVIREHLLLCGEMLPSRLHKMATRFVKAKAQADALHALLDRLTEEEQGVVRRGRNAKSGSAPKNAEMIDYRHATGFESLLGYLYLQRRFDRLREITGQALEFLEQQNEQKGSRI